MPSEAKKPVILLAFANERDDLVRYLRKLPEEARNIRGILEGAKRDGLCDYKEIPNATLKEILDVFQDPKYKDRIAIFHYAGHANSYQLMLESPEGRTTAAYAGGLASFLGQQTGLELVFLNGCATQKQVQGLLDANVSAVISTSRAIDDGAAKEFATRFYTGLAAGSSIRRAYNEAEAAMKTAHGDDSRSLYAKEGSAIDQVDDRVPLDRDRLPWDPGPSPGADLAAQWVMATEFASRLYKGLVGGNDIQKAYNDARVAIQTAPKTAPQITRGSNTRNLYLAECKSVDMVDDRLPWDLRLRKGAEKADQWSLPNAVKDPLYGLPKIPDGDLPPCPFRHLSWFAREHAEVFFGRGQEIRELHQRVTDSHSAPIILFYGQSGVGKSSVLAAGLFPRLEEKHEIRYVRRDSKKGLLGTVKEAISPKEGVTISESWLDQESRTGKPLIVMVDQVEEAFTRPNPDLPRELDEFWDALQAIFSDPAHRPKGKLILGFRKEWLAEIEKQLIDRKISFSGLPLEPLKREGIIESVNGPAKSERLQQKYRLEVEDGLAEIIADDLLEDRESAIAPAMQILLTKMWERATEMDHDHPTFNRDLYQTLKKKGILLQDFLEQQLAALERWNSEVVNSGLALDFLAFHTTPLGTAEEQTEEDLQKNYRYQKSQVVNSLVQQCKDLYLLDKPTKTAPTRLSHDTLAPLVRQLFATSDRPGQRARRVLENRSVDWQDDKQGTPLDEQDLELVEQGKDGMRAWEPAEERLVVASQEEREKKRNSRRNLRILGTVAIVAIIFSVLIAGWAEVNRLEAEQDSIDAMARQLAAQALNRPEDQLDLALLLGLEASGIKDNIETRASLFELLERNLRLIYSLNSTFYGIENAVFSLDGKFLITVSPDGGIQLFNISSDKPMAGPINRIGGYFPFNALSSDGKLLALADYSGGGIVLWDVAKNRKIAQLGDGSQFSATSLAFNDQGTLFAGGLNDGTIFLWSIYNASHVVSFYDFQGHNQWISSLAFSPDNKTLVSAGENIKFWDIENRTELMPAIETGSPIRCLCFSLDGEILVFGDSKGGIHLYNMTTRFKQDLTGGHNGSVASMALSPDGILLASGGMDKVIKLWNIKSGKLIDGSLVGHNLGIKSLDFGPNNLLASTGGLDHKILLWDANAVPISRVGTILADHADPSSILAFGANGSLASGGSDGMIIFWSIRDHQPIGVHFSHNGKISGIAFNPSKTLLASASGNGDLAILSIKERQQFDLSHDSGKIKAIAFSRDGSKLASIDDSINIWDINSRRPISSRSLEENPLGTYDTEFRSISFDRNDKLLASGSKYDTSGFWSPNIWDGQTGKLIGDGTFSAPKHSAPISSIAFSPKGDVIATGGEDKAIILWDTRNGETIDKLSGNIGTITTLGFSPDGVLLAAGSKEGTIALWDIEGRKPFGQPLMGHSSSIYSLAFSQDNKILASSATDGTIMLWDMDLDSWKKRARQIANRDLTKGERSQFLAQASSESIIEHILRIIRSVQI